MVSGMYTRLCPDQAGKDVQQVSWQVLDRMRRADASGRLFIALASWSYMLNGFALLTHIGCAVLGRFTLAACVCS